MYNEKVEDILKSIGSEELPADVQRIAEKTCGDFAETLTRTRQTKHFML